MKKRVHLEFYEETFLKEMLADSDFASYVAGRTPVISAQTLSLLEPAEQNTEQIARAQVLTAVKDRAEHALADTISRVDFKYDEKFQYDKVVGQKKTLATEWIGICRVVEVTSE